MTVFSFLCLHVFFPLCLCPNLFFLLGHQSYWIRAHPHDLFQDPVSNYSHILRYWIWTYKLGRHTSCIAHDPLHCFCALLPTPAGANFLCLECPVGFLGRSSLLCFPKSSSNVGIFRKCVLIPAMRNSSPPPGLWLLCCICQSNTVWYLLLHPPKT